MKHGKITKIIAMVMVCCMNLSIAMPAGAVGRYSSGSSYASQWKSFWGDFFGSISGGSNGNTDSDTNTDAGNIDSGSNTGSTGDVNGVMTLVEDDTTVSAGTALRASTYVLNNNATTYADSTTTLKYFPVTLYNYDATTINNATHQVEVDGGLGDTWNGIYFSKGAPSAESYTYSTGGEVSYKSTTVNYKSNNDYNSYINTDYYVDVNGIKYLVTGITCTRNGNWMSGYTYSWTIKYDGGTTSASTASITLYQASTDNTYHRQPVLRRMELVE